MASLASKDTSFANLPVVAKVLVLVFLLGMISVLYYFALHMPLADDIDSAEAKHAQLKQRLAEAERRQEEYLRLSQELADREAIDRKNTLTLPEEAEIAAFLQDLNGVAELSGLRIRMVEPRPEEAQELYVRIPVSLELTGQYHQIMKFFYNVSRVERAINMENVSLTNPREEDGEVLLDVHVLATTFRRRGAGDQAPPQGPAKTRTRARGGSG